MKTISTITLLGLLLTVSCGQKEVTETPAPSETEDSFSSREVYKDPALDLMGAYQLWRSMNPDSVRWDSSTNTLHFEPITFDSIQDSEIINRIKYITEVYAEIKKEKTGPDMRFPFTKKEDQALSFYIDKRDIDSINSLMGATNFNGYRAHLAVEPYPKDGHILGLTHLLLAPAKWSQSKGFEDLTLRNRNGKEIFLDLILPCPNGCPNNVTPNYMKDFQPWEHESSK